MIYINKKDQRNKILVLFLFTNFKERKDSINLKISILEKHHQYSLLLTREYLHILFIVLNILF